MPSGSLTKTPPHDTEAEKAVLGGILIDPAAVSLVAEIIGAQHFYVPAHGLIFSSMLTLFEKNQPVDVVTLSAELKKHGELTKIGGGSYLADLIDTV
ncbi:MAG: DnaB-like helicase N-terminal domain-containing protein, partial [Microgenomates group bacterium]